jgi:hypothetical protein
MHSSEASTQVRRPHLEGPQEIALSEKSIEENPELLKERQRVIAKARARDAKLCVPYARVLARGSRPHVSPVKISGVESGKGSLVNGTFFPVDGESCGGKPVYKKQDEDAWIEYTASDKWQIKPAESKGTSNCWMTSRESCKQTRTVEEVFGGWKVWNVITNKWEMQKRCSVEAVSVQPGTLSSQEEHGHPTSSHL